MRAESTNKCSGTFKGRELKLAVLPDPQRLSEIANQLSRLFPVPAGHTEASWLRELTMQGAARRYGPPERERVRGAYRQLAYELDMIEQLDFPGAVE